MDTRFIEVRKNITIPLNILAGTGSYTCTINTVNFIPDEVIVKYINYTSSRDIELGVTTFIYSDLVSDILGSFFINNTTKPETAFTLRRPIFGFYRFNMQSVTGEVEDLRIGEMGIHLEFVKYRTDLPDVKIY